MLPQYEFPREALAEKKSLFSFATPRAVRWFYPSRNDFKKAQGNWNIKKRGALPPSSTTLPTKHSQHPQRPY